MLILVLFLLREAFAPNRTGLPDSDQSQLDDDTQKLSQFIGSYRVNSILASNATGPEEHRIWTSGTYQSDGDSHLNTNKDNGQQKKGFEPSGIEEQGHTESNEILQAQFDQDFAEYVLSIPPDSKDASFLRATAYEKDRNTGSVNPGRSDKRAAINHDKSHESPETHCMNKKGSFKCECNRTFMKRADLSKHSRLCQGLTNLHSPRFICNECAAVYWRSGDLVKHQINCICPANVRSKGSTCDKCNSKLSSKLSLNRHLLNCNGIESVNIVDPITGIVTNEKYRCPTCGMQCRNAGGIAMHIRTCGRPSEEV